MAAEQWLLLTDYASKYRISVSTLRRRIKANQIPFRFESGKYFILDAAPSHPEMAAFTRETPIFPGLKTLPVEPAPLVSQQTQFQQPQYQTPRAHESFHELQLEQESWMMQDLSGATNNKYPSPTPPPAPQTERARMSEQMTAPTQTSSTIQDQVDEPLITTATKLLNELKRAYANILHEKEEQIIQLKEELSDLKTWVRALEEDNERMRRILGTPGR